LVSSQWYKPNSSHLWRRVPPAYLGLDHWREAAIRVLPGKLQIWIRLAKEILKISAEKVRGGARGGARVGLDNRYE